MNEIGEMLFWAAILLAGVLAFQWWANREQPAPRFQLDTTEEWALHASYRNTDVSFSDYDRDEHEEAFVA